MSWYFSILGSLLVLMLVLIAILIHEPRRKRRIRRGQCSRCGYDMMHVDHTTCPECGHRWEQD